MPAVHPRMDTYARTGRDLGSPELWRRSLLRSRHRRHIADIDRRHKPRRKGATMAISAAMLAAPIAPSLTTAFAASGGGTSNSLVPLES